jgi:uncharacterized membrane protein YebE (DUF533 family)
MDLKRRGMVALFVTGSMAGGAVGATVLSATSSSAATTTTTTANGAPAGAPAGGQHSGKFVSNENPSHEKGESAQREAQETAGQFPTVP